MDKYSFGEKINIRSQDVPEIKFKKSYYKGHFALVCDNKIRFLRKRKLE